LDLINIWRFIPFRLNSIYFILPNVINPIYTQKLTGALHPSIQNEKLTGALHPSIQNPVEISKDITRQPSQCLFYTVNNP
jgi:hypothetical protein